jgi:hypothetical protein
MLPTTSVPIESATFTTPCAAVQDRASLRTQFLPSAVLPSCKILALHSAMTCDASLPYGAVSVCFLWHVQQAISKHTM